MKTVFIAIGSRGDVEPYIALAQRMSQRGHDVGFATHARMLDLVVRCGLRGHLLSGDPLAIVHGPKGRAWIDSGNNPLRFLTALAAVLEPLAEQVVREMLAACGDAELIIPSRLAVMPAIAISRRTGAWCVPAYLQPAHPTEAFPSIYLPFGTSFGPFGNRLSHVVAEQIYWGLFRRWLFRMRAKGVELLDPPTRIPQAMIRGPGLLGASGLVVPASPTDPVQPTGYWVLNTETTWAPSRALVDFITAGEPPICIGFGSMTVAQPERLAAIVRAALLAVGRRAIVLTGWGALDTIAPDRDVFVLKEAPHSWLLPRVAMMIHHGGAGTTAACLRAGIPSIVVPFFADQRFWARRLTVLGAAPTALPLKRLTSGGLAALISQVDDEACFSQCASDLSARLADEDGLSEAVGLLERLLE